MKMRISALIAAAALVLFSPRAVAKVAAVYATGQGGFQNTGDTDPGLGFELGARVLIFDGYVDYMGFGANQAVSRAILGLRGGFGTRNVRLVLRGGLGAIHEERGALTDPLGAPTRTGAVARVGGDVEGRLNSVFWLGLGVDGETYAFPDNSLGYPTRGSDVFASMKLTFELGL